MKRLLFFVVITLLAIQMSVWAANNPILRYTFDANTIQVNKDNTITVKDTAGKNDGTANGGANQAGNAMVFDGKSGYVVTPALDARIAAKVPFTAMGWFKTSQGLPNGPLWMWGDNAKPSSSSGAEGPVGWRTSTKFLAAGFYVAAHFYADAKADYADNKWHVVAQVADDKIGYLYVDGSLISQTSAGYVYAANPYCLIGARTKNSGSELDDTEYFNGSIDMFLLYTVALDANEIKQVSSQGNPVAPAEKLVTCWGQIKGNSR